MGVGAAEPADFGQAVVRGMGANKAIPTIVFQGKSDKTVNPANAENIVSQLLSGFDVSASTARKEESGVTPQGYHFARRLYGKPVVVEEWTVDELGHAWSGGSKDGTYTDEKGPDATTEMLRFLLQHRHA
jgi:poly(3-hydroxybutyrate) depolymerase